LTTRRVAIVGGAVGLLASGVVLVLLWFGVAGVLRIGHTDLMYLLWPSSLMLTITWDKTLGEEVVFRADAAFAKPEIYEALEKQGVKYAIRLPANVGLERDIEELLTRPVGRPSHKPIEWYKGFLHQVASSKTARRGTAVKMTLRSCHRFRSNQVRLALSLLAYNLANLWRRLGFPRGIES
jgi:hypothetical protein